jgi:eukaryotic-like serine/threonine-protein kinase
VLRACHGERSRDLDDLVEWLTEPDPGNRPASARQALARLDRADPEPEAPTQVYEATRAEPRAPTQRPSPPPIERPRSSGARRGALLALLAFVAAVVAIAAIALGGGGDGGGTGTQAKKSPPANKTAGGGSKASAEPEESPEPETSAEPENTPAAAPAPEPKGSDPETGSALNQQGYELIQAGEYDAAVPVLEEAVAAFPAGSEELDYAYALFNLGNALRLSGRPDEAIPVLEQRLEIPNQTGTVEEELATARAEAG